MFGAYLEGAGLDGWGMGKIRSSMGHLAKITPAGNDELVGGVAVAEWPDWGWCMT